MSYLHKTVSSLVLLIIVLSSAQADTVIYGNTNSPLPSIRFVGDKDYPPIEWLEEGEPRGIFPSFLKEYAKAIDRKVEYQLMDWREAQQAVLEGRADVLTVFSPNEERIKHFDFVDSFLNFEISLFLRKDNLTIHDLKDLKGIKTGVTAGGFPRKVITTQSQAEIITIKDHLSGFQQLLQGEIDTLATTKWVGAYTIQKHHLEGIKFAEKPIATKPTHMGIRKGDLELINTLKIGIEKLETSGKLEQLHKQWSGFNIIYITEDKLEKIYFIVTITLLLIILITGLSIITGLKKQVKERTQSLEDSNANLHASLITLEQTQHKLIEAKKTEALISIVANIAHKINTPLGIIVTLTSTLETNSKAIKKQFEANTLSQRALAEYINDAISSLELCISSTKKTSHLVNNFKKLTTNQNLEAREHFNLQQTAEDVLAITQPEIDHKRITIKLIGTQAIFMDSYQAPLAQVLIILINNALEHAFKNQPSGSIALHMSKDKSYAHLSISDDGCGISEQHLTHLYDPFFTIHKELSGSGLGLSIVYSIVTQILGGEIKVESTERVGTKFTLSIPLSAPFVSSS